MALIDGHGRTIDYLRLSVTDRCDLRCSYCIPKGFRDFAEPAAWLDFDRLETLVGVFARLGVSRLRLTGGEPLLRRGVVELAARLAALPGVEDLSLSTNGTRLAAMAGPLRHAGVSRLNVSLDTLDPARFASVCGRAALPEVLAGLDAARAAGFDLIKINSVLLPGVNEDEVEAMAEFCMARGLVLRFIETMPMGETGRAQGYVALGPVRERLRARYGLTDAVLPGAGPARYLRSADGRLAVGFITPRTQHFCAACNRLRVDVEGVMHLCLGRSASHDLGALLRRGATAADLEAAIRAAVAAKPARHDFSDPRLHPVRIMARTGG